MVISATFIFFFINKTTLFNKVRFFCFYARKQSKNFQKALRASKMSNWQVEAQLCVIIKI